MQTVTLQRPIALRLTIGIAEDLKRRGVFDVFTLVTEPEELQSLMTDTTLLCLVTWAMSDQVGMNYEQFAEWFLSTDRVRLWDAVFEELKLFFQPPMRPVVGALIESAKSANAVACEEMRRLVMASQPNLVSESESEPGNESGSSPVLSGSTRDLSAGVSFTTWPSGVCVANGGEQAA